MPSTDQQIDKPVVIYTDAAQRIVHDLPARLCVLEHPKVGSGWVTTSAVQYIDGEVIETRNTVYRPASRLADDEIAEHMLAQMYGLS